MSKRRNSGSRNSGEGVAVADLCASVFHPVLGDVMCGGHVHYWLNGGRGSTKSSFISLCLVLLVVANPFANAVVIRRFSNTLRDSVYQQLIWAVDVLGLTEFFRARVSPMELEYLPTGQRIVFRGADDPLKLKGTKFTTGYCACVWFEEVDQFDSIDTVRSILNSLRRGGERFWIFYSYNPPRSALNWVNAEERERHKRADTLVLRTSYLDVVDEHPEWLGVPFIEEAEYLRESNELAWRWEYLGEVTGTGGAVFANITGRAIGDDEIARMELVRNGIDWGWFPDPWRYVRVGWEPSERRLFVFGELTANKMLPQDTGALVVEALTYPDYPGDDAYFHDELIWCDDTADGKVAMATYKREHGLRARPARKGRMRRLSYEWLAGLREIVIDPARAPHAFEEFSAKEYERDREGNWVDEIPDGNDHSIDAVRYAMMEDVLRGR